MFFKDNPIYIKAIRTVSFAVLFALSSGCKPQSFVQISGPASRIISCAPSITETLFALGLGNKVVGVTNYCKYPAEAEHIEIIGGYTDINLEKVISLKPDVVILQQEHQKQRNFLTQFGIKIVTVDNKTCSSICSSFVLIGRACGARRSADSLVKIFDNSLRKQANAKYTPKVLICVGRDNPGAGAVQSAFVVSTATYYNEIIEAAGGVNAFVDSLPHYPKISREGIISLAPDIIIDLASSMSSYTCSTLVEDWNSLPMIPAIKTGRVFCISADYSTIPGPRILLLLQDLRRVIHSTESVKL